MAASSWSPCASPASMWGSCLVGRPSHHTILALGITAGSLLCSRYLHVYMAFSTSGYRSSVEVAYSSIFFFAYLMCTTVAHILHGLPLECDDLTCTYEPLANTQEFTTVKESMAGKFFCSGFQYTVRNRMLLQHPFLYVYS